jgi:hypothetical protein
MNQHRSVANRFFALFYSAFLLVLSLGKQLPSLRKILQFQGKLPAELNGHLVFTESSSSLRSPISGCFKHSYDIHNFYLNGKKQEIFYTKSRVLSSKKNSFDHDDYSFALLPEEINLYSVGKNHFIVNIPAESPQLFKMDQSGSFVYQKTYDQLKDSGHMMTHCVFDGEASYFSFSNQEPFKLQQEFISLDKNDFHIKNQKVFQHILPLNDFLLTTAHHILYTTGMSKHELITKTSDFFKEGGAYQASSLHVCRYDGYGPTISYPFVKQTHVMKFVGIAERKDSLIVWFYGMIEPDQPLLEKKLLEPRLHCVEIDSSQLTMNHVYSDNFNSLFSIPDFCYDSSSSEKSYWTKTVDSDLAAKVTIDLKNAKASVEYLDFDNLIYSKPILLSVGKQLDLATLTDRSNGYQLLIHDDHGVIKASCDVRSCLPLTQYKGKFYKKP